jgi:AAA family ATP:ADP antiporter
LRVAKRRRRSIYSTMSGQDRDPFPMRSAEASDLANSVNDGRGDGNWNTMETTTGATGRRGKKGPKSKADASGTSLLGGNNANRRNAESADSDDDGSDDEDDYLDTPIDSLYSPRNPLSIVNFASHYTRSRGKSRLTQMFQKLYGKDVPFHEVRRVMFLGATLFFMIGGYWLLRSLKDPVLTALCGVTVIPKAKMVSVFVVLFMVSIYNKLLSTDIPKHKLFYIFGTFYFAIFSVIAMLLKDPVMGLDNQIPDPNRWLGWVSYCAIESFGSVMVSLFWSFANSVTSLESAKATYGLMVALAQLGSIIGPTIVNQYADTMGVANIYQIGAVTMLLLQITMAIYIHLYGTEMHDYRTPYDKVAAMSRGSVAKKPEKKSKAGVLEGLVLFWKYNYIKGIFAISCLFMVEVTIVDYTMKVLAKDHFAELFPCEQGMSCWDATLNQPSGLSQGSTEAFTKFMGLFGQATNTLSFVTSLFGTSAVIRTLGLRLSLLLFPTMCLVIIVLVRLNPTLWMVFGAMMMLKGFSYALNNPTKEILYQPTSHAVKFKAKSWIDIFGARGSKALGSVVTNAFSHSAQALVSNGSLVGMCVASFLIWNANFMGKKFDEYTEKGYIVGSEEEEDAQRKEEAMLNLAINQNDQDDEEGGDTSCAIHHDDQVGALEEGQSCEGDDDDEDDEEEDPDADLDDLIETKKNTTGPPPEVVSI